MLRTHTCGELRDSDAGAEVQLCGWVDTVRDQGGVIFIDLRDRYGITQVVIEESESAAARDLAHHTRTEYVIQAMGSVRLRPADMVNAKLDTGAIEVHLKDITVLNQSQTPPFPLDEEKSAKVSEDLRMKYRFLDLRRRSMQAKLRARHKITQAVRTYFDGQEFVEVETPIMTKSTPEGARDYLVPNRLTPGTFYALPQAPQQYKQILMVAGMDRYFQIARCFRDEDLRSDRQPEFTQIDLEMSFVEPEDIYGVLDGCMAAVMETAGLPVPELPLPRMSWHEAMNTWGSDKPDLRFGVPLVDISSVFADTGFKVFGKVLESGGVIKAINAKTLAGIPIRVIEEWTELAKQAGMGGLAFIRVQEDGSWKSPITKFFSETEVEALREQLDIQVGDLVLFAATELAVANAFLGQLRLLAAEEGDLVDASQWKFTWVTEFPLFETNQEGRLVPMHHPFTSVYPEDVDLLESDPSAARSQAYDLVLNGVELGSGSIRIHNPELQSKMFDVLKISEEEQQELFGHLLNALSYGAPPHGGFAVGFDRLVALVAGGETIRDVIAFPKNHKGVDLMMEAPSTVDEKQLRAVHIALNLPSDDEDE